MERSKLIVETQDLYFSRCVVDRLVNCRAACLLGLQTEGLKLLAVVVFAFNFLYQLLLVLSSNLFGKNLEACHDWLVVGENNILAGIIAQKLHYNGVGLEKNPISIGGNSLFSGGIVAGGAAVEFVCREKIDLALQKRFKNTCESPIVHSVLQFGAQVRMVT